MINAVFRQCFNTLWAWNNSSTVTSIPLCPPEPTARPDIALTGDTQDCKKKQKLK